MGIEPMMNYLVDLQEKREIDIGSNGMSIDLLRAVYRNPSIPLPVRMRAAIACLPHETPRLAVMGMVSEQSFAELLERRLRHQAQILLVNSPDATFCECYGLAIGPGPTASVDGQNGSTASTPVLPFAFSDH
jgi:hypothetical protein